MKFAAPCILFLSMAFAISSAAEDKYAIRLVVEGADSDQGQIFVSVFDSEEKYMRQPLVETKATVNAEGRAIFDLGNHSSGWYAITVYYDRNGNGELDTGLFRIPKEKVGFSNNARGKFGPAKWNKARFLLSDADLQIEIQLKRAKRER